MKKLLFIATLFISNFCFSQARELTGRDTVNHRPGLIYKDTLKTLQADSPIVITTVSPYLLKLSLSSGFLGGTWTASTLYPTKMYAGIGTNTYTKVGIGTDTPRAPLQIKSPILANTACDSCGILLSNDSISSITNQYYSPPITFQGNGWGQTATSPTGYRTIRMRNYLVPVEANAIWPTATLNWDFLSSASTWTNIMKLYSGGGISIVNSVPININVTSQTIDNGNTGNYLILSNTNGNAGVKILGGSTNYFFRGTTTIGGLFQYANNASTGLAINDFSSATYANTNAILDLGSTSKGFLMPRMKSNQRDTLTSAITTLSITNAGSGYTNGTYFSTASTALTGNGVNAKIEYVVSGGIVTAATTNFGNQTTGNGFKIGDQLTVPTLGGTGSGGIVTVTGVTTAIKALKIYDTTISEETIHDTLDNWKGRVFNNSLSTMALWYGDDYVFNGTTSTYTLPTIGGNYQGSQNGIKIINLGSGSITLNSASGSQIIPTASTTAQASLTITTGQSVELFPTGTAFKVLYQN